MKERRPEAEGFVQGVLWASLHLVEAAARMHNEAAAVQLLQAARELQTASKIRANELWPPFDPLTPGSKGLLGPG